MKNYGIILASGTGNRYGSDIPKQFVKIAGKTILEHTIEIFENSPFIDEIFVVITPEYRHVAENILLKNKYKKITHLLNGGKTRKDSSYIGINAVEEEEANVLIHDCARPFLTQEIIANCVKALEKHDAIDVAIPATDTIIETENGLITNIPDRSRLQQGQTPQCFKLSLIKKAHELSKNDVKFTEDCGLIVKHKLADVFVVNGDIENIKDKVIVIFGGTSGIGESIANKAEKLGAKVYVCSRRTGCDVASFKSVNDYLKKVYEESKHIDFIVNTAGLLRMGKLSEREIDDIEREINVNYLGSINVAKAAIPYLQETEGCILLFTSSSYTRGRAMYSTYSSTKAGVVNLTQALAEELYNDGIRINVINPERTATPMRTKAFGEEPADSLLNPEKVADVSLKALLSNLTGQVIDVRR